MDRRDVSIILIFLMLAVGGGLPQSLHWKVDHGCCGSACAIAPAPEAASPSTPCCPHHHHNHNDHQAHADNEREAASSDQHVAVAEDDGADEFDFGKDGAPSSPDNHDCSLCQFLATLSAVVSSALTTPVAIDPIDWTVVVPGATVHRISHISSQGPRAPPHIA